MERVIAPEYGVAFHQSEGAWSLLRVERPEGMDVWLERSSGAEGHMGSLDTVVGNTNSAQFIAGPNALSLYGSPSIISERIWVMGDYAKDAFTGVSRWQLDDEIDNEITSRDWDSSDGKYLFSPNQGRDRDQILVTDLLTGEGRMIEGVAPSASAQARKSQGGAIARSRRFRNDGERIYMSDGSSVMTAVDIASGQIAWTQDFGDTVDMIATDGETLVATLSEDDNFSLEASYGYRMNRAVAVVGIDRATVESFGATTALQGGRTSTSRLILVPWFLRAI